MSRKPADPRAGRIGADLRDERTPRQQDGAEITPFLGRRVTAKYRSDLPHAIRGNPFAEVVASLGSRSDMIKRLRRLPPAPTTEERALPADMRKLLLEASLAEFFQPLPAHVDLAGRLQLLILRSYLGRNPVEPDGPRRLFAAPTGMTIFGPSGSGKTLTSEAILDLHAQLVDHSMYGGRPFTRTQVVWIKLECPANGSVRSFCMSFFHTFDLLLGTEYRRRYGAGRPNRSELLSDMKDVAWRHGLAIVVIDEVQRLVGRRSANVVELIDFVVQLSNELRVPVVMIGTYAALDLMGGNFQQARRGVGQGSIFWDRLHVVDDDRAKAGTVDTTSRSYRAWRLFTTSLWRYQYTLHVTALTDKLLQEFYSLSQGVPSIAVSLFKMAQDRAMETSDANVAERLTVGLLKSVYADSFYPVHSYLNALRDRDLGALRRMPDLVPVVDGRIAFRLTSPEVSEDRPENDQTDANDAGTAHQSFEPRDDHGGKESVPRGDGPRQPQDTGDRLLPAGAPGDEPVKHSARQPERADSHQPAVTVLHSETGGQTSATHSNARKRYRAEPPSLPGRAAVDIGEGPSDLTLMAIVERGRAKNISPADMIEAAGLRGFPLAILGSPAGGHVAGGEGA